jgi:hypothetical protein
MPQIVSPSVSSGPANITDRALINKGVSADKLVLVPLWREASSPFDKRVAMTAVFAQSESNSIRCLTTEIVNQRYPFTNRGNMP